MLVKLNKIDEDDHKVNVTLLEIDELDLVFSMRDINLKILSGDNSIVTSLKLYQM